MPGKKNVRQRARTWLTKTNWNSSEPFYASKLYPPEESWTRGYAWWFEFPRKVVYSRDHAHVNLLCESAGESEEFYCLRLPCRFIQEKHGLLGYRETTEKYSLIISAEKSNAFREMRGAGKVDLAEFVK